MRAISKAAQAILERLAAGLNAVGDSRRVGGKIGESAIMPVSVERVGPRQVSVAHYYKQRGDTMRDPEVVYWFSPDGKVYPIEWTQDGMPGLLGYHELVTFEGNKPVRYAKAHQKDVAVFTTQWMENIREQQSDWFEGKVQAAENISDVESEPATEPTAAVTASMTEAVMTDAEIWGAEAEALADLIMKALGPVLAMPKYAKYQQIARPLVVKALIRKLASGAVPKKGYVVGPQGGAIEVDEAPAPRPATPKQATPRPATPVMQPAPKTPKGGYTREQAESAILAAWEQFRVARADLFVA